MEKIVFAISTPEGQFKELLSINNYQIIEFLDQNDHGVNMVKIKDVYGVMVIYHYIDFIELY